MTGIPAVTASQMAFIDRLMAERFGVSPVQLMEHAGYAVANFVRAQLPDGDAFGQRVVLLAGSGGNGGDALVAARLLAAWGADIAVVLARPATALTGLPAAHLRSVEVVGIPVLDGAGLSRLPAAAIVVDGLLGSGATGDPTGTTAELIALANGHGAPVVAIDLPSGLDATTGHVNTPCIVATSTLTLGLPKTGLLAASAAAVTGNLMLAGIGIPPAAYHDIGVEVPTSLFSATWLVPIPGHDHEREGISRGD